jgi:AcrR family transcriptional regulator
LHGLCTDPYGSGLVAAVHSDNQPGGAMDGRTRAAVVESLLELIGEGHLRPTAREIADRAGISLRSVYVHFEDLEDLFVSAAQEHAQSIRQRWQPVDPALPYPQRRERYVVQRAHLLEFVVPVARAAALHEQTSPALAAELRRGARLTAAELRAVFASEFERMMPEAGRATLEALTVLMGADTWHALRTQRDLDRPTACVVLAHALDAFLADS